MATSGEVLKQALPLIGREAELTALAARLDSAAAGHGGVLLLAGDAGVGKSRLVDELVRRTGVEAWRASSNDTASPFAPIVKLLRDRERSHAGWLGTTGPLHGQLAVLLPEAGPSPDLPNRLALIDGLRDAIAALPVTSAAVVVLDDLQWSDEATLELLPVLARSVESAALLIIGIYRSDEIQRGHGLRRMRAELRRAHRLEELMVEPLSFEETERLIAAMIGRSPGPELTRILHDRTAGVPFFLEELTSALLAQGRILDSGDAAALAAGVPLPETIRDAVRLRTDRISESGQRALEIASVIGMRVDLTLLGEEETGIDEAIGSGFLVEVSEREAAFRHPLVRESIYADIPWTRRRHFHKEIAEKLERREASSEAIAEQWIGAHEPERARPRLLEAAREFCALHAYRDAARAGRRALELWPEASDESDRLEALERLGHCAEMCGELAEAARAWEEVRDAHSATGNTESLAEVSRRLAGVYDMQGMPERTRSAREQAAAAFEACGRIADMIVERLAIAERLELAGSGTAALTMLMALYPHIERIASVDLRIRALALEGEFRAKLGEREEGIAASRRAIALALQHGEAEPMAEAYYRLGAALENACDHEGAVEAYTAARGFCLDQKISGLAQVCLACMLPCVLLTGQWNRTLEVSQSVLQSPDSPDVARAKAKLFTGIVGVLRGNLGRAQRLLEETYAFGQQAMLVPIEVYSTWGLMRAAELAGRDDEAFERAVEFVRRARTRDEKHYSVPPLRFAATLFARRGDARNLGACADILGKIADATGHPECLGPFAHALAERALLEGKPEMAIEQFDAAARLMGEAGVVYERAETQLRGAAALLSAGRRDTAVERLTEVYRTARKLGARPLASRAADELRTLGEPVEQKLGKRAANDASGGSLSQREIEVLRLVTDGLTNREIAERLFVSKRTVDMHVRNVLTRLGCRSRIEAAGRGRSLNLS